MHSQMKRYRGRGVGTGAELPHLSRCTALPTSPCVPQPEALQIWSFGVFICVYMKVTQLFLTPWTHGLYSPWNSPGQNTGVGSLSLFQAIFPTQGSNLPPHCRQILYHLSHKVSPMEASLQRHDWLMISGHWQLIQLISPTQGPGRWNWKFLSSNHFVSSPGSQLPLLWLPRGYHSTSLT